MREHIDVGWVLSEIAEQYKGNVAPLLASAMIIFLPVAVATALLQRVSPVAGLLVLPVAIVVQAVYVGAVIALVDRVYSRAAMPSVGGLFRTVGPHIGRLVVTGFVAAVGVSLGFILVIVPGLYLLTIWAVFAPVIVIERAGVSGSLARSHQLVRGDGWQVFGSVVVIGIVTQIFAFVVGAVLGRGFVGLFLSFLLPSVLLVPVSAIAAAVVYFELRRLEEGATATAAES